MNNKKIKWKKFSKNNKNKMEKVFQKLCEGVGCILGKRALLPVFALARVFWKWRN
jgi:hypothetical protein